MNEEQKNIETCLPENILSEVANVPQDPQFRSLVNESLDPLKRQALRQAGYDGYDKVAGTHQPYTFTSQVKQMKSNLILLLRRLWRFPFGSGTIRSLSAGSSASDAAPIRSLADMWQHYINRLKGNAEYSIPSRLSQLTDLPSAPALLADRKISGVPEAVDGISLVQLLGGAYSDITELTDDNEGWTLTKAFPWSIFPNVKKAVLNMVSMPNNTDLGYSGLEELVCNHLKKYYATTGIGIKAKKVSLEELEEVSLSDGSGISNCVFIGLEQEELTLPSLVKADIVRGSDYSMAALICDNSHIRKLNMPVLTWFRHGRLNGTIRNCANLEVLGMDSLTNLQDNTYITHPGFLSGCPKLIELRFGIGYSANLYLGDWSPTLDSSNIQQFLSNFKTYIAERLTDEGSGLTLTLSQEVRNAIHAAEDEYGIENIIITQKGWTISPAPN